MHFILIRKIKKIIQLRFFNTSVLKHQNRMAKFRRIPTPTTVIFGIRTFDPWSMPGAASNSTLNHPESAKEGEADQGFLETMILIDYTETIWRLPRWGNQVIGA